MLAAVAAAAVVTGGTLAVTQTPASAHEDCILLHITLNRQNGPDIIHLCVI